MLLGAPKIAQLKTLLKSLRTKFVLSWLNGLKTENLLRRKWWDWPVDSWSFGIEMRRNMFCSKVKTGAEEMGQKNRQRTGDRMEIYKILQNRNFIWYLGVRFIQASLNNGWFQPTNSTTFRFQQGTWWLTRRYPIQKFFGPTQTGPLCSFVGHICDDKVLS